MKTMFLAALAILALDVGAAFAQGGAASRAPVYGSKWADQVLAARRNAAEPVANATNNVRVGLANKDVRGETAPLVAKHN